MNDLPDRLDFYLSPIFIRFFLAIKSIAHDPLTIDHARYWRFPLVLVSGAAETVRIFLFC